MNKPLFYLVKVIKPFPHPEREGMAPKDDEVVLHRSAANAAVRAKRAKIIKPVERAPVKRPVGRTGSQASALQRRAAALSLESDEGKAADLAHALGEELAAMNVSDLREEVLLIEDSAVLVCALEAEEAGKKRVSAISAIRDRWLALNPDAADDEGNASE